MEASYIDLIQAGSDIASSLLAVTALLYSIRAYSRSIKISHYNELDKTYQSLLRIALRNTYFIRPETITTREQHDKYNIYAFMVWNFLESIYDKCMEDEHLRETWLPIIEVEGDLHFKWFLREENKPKFKPAFYMFIETLLNPSGERVAAW